MKANPVKLLILVVMSVVGLVASSTVLYVYYLLHQPLFFCSLPQKIWPGITVDCNAVLGSNYDNVFGLNLDVLAVSYFIINLALIFMVAFGSDRLYEKAFKVLFGWRFVGLAIVPYLMTVEFAILKTICIYCTVMHASILIDFAIITYFVFYKKSVRTFLAPSQPESAGSQLTRPAPVPHSAASH